MLRAQLWWQHCSTNCTGDDSWLAIIKLQGDGAIFWYGDQAVLAPIPAFRCSKTTRPALGPKKQHIKMVPGFLSSVIQRPDGQVYHKPPRSAEVQNECSCVSNSPICLRSGHQHKTFSSGLQGKRQTGHVDVYVIHKCYCRPTPFSSLHVDCCRRHS